MRLALVAGVVVCALAVPRAARAAFFLRGTAADTAAFLEMLRTCTCKEMGLGEDGITVRLISEPPIEECPGATPGMRALVNRFLVSDASIDIHVGRNTPGIFLDGFDGDGRGFLDLADVEELPAQAPTNSPNCSTRCQQLGHVLGEYTNAATNGIPYNPAPPPGGDPDYNDSHPSPETNAPGTGFGTENQQRTESGQTTTLLSGTWTPMPGGVPGYGTFTLTYSDGSQEHWDVRNNDIQSVACP